MSISTEVGPMTDKRFEMFVWATFPCIPITQPIGTFYMTVIDSRSLVEISFSDIIRIEKDKREIEVVSGLERPISKTRINELREYVKTVDASFPSGVILAVSSAQAKYHSENNTIEIYISKDTAKIIDGQHRIEGLRGYVGTNFQMCCAIFIDMDTEDQALVFSVINLKQAAVNKSITYQLFQYAKTRSPQKTCHSIARTLNLAAGSPFLNKIMILGTADDTEKETLSQATFIKPLQRLITRPDMAMADRDALKRRRGLRPPTLEEVRTNQWIFRMWFIEEEDNKITQVMVNYFHAVSRRWPEAWNVKARGMILNRTNGYNALMRFLPLVTFKLGLDKVHKVEAYDEYLDRVRLKDEEINVENFPAGSTGEGLLFRQLLRDTGINEKQAWASPEQ
jgi:DGQHR domain-containing protein